MEEQGLWTDINSKLINSSLPRAPALGARSGYAIYMQSRGKPNYPESCRCLVSNPPTVYSPSSAEE